MEAEGISDEEIKFVIRRVDDEILKRASQRKPEREPTNSLSGRILHSFTTGKAYIVIGCGIIIYSVIPILLFFFKLRPEHLSMMLDFMFIPFYAAMLIEPMVGVAFIVFGLFKKRWYEGPSQPRRHPGRNA
jgi:hypothetical protein